MSPACRQAGTLVCMALVRSLLAAVLIVLPVRAEAGEFVHFKSGNATLVGYLAKPSGRGPFPAVVLLHGSGGFHASMLSWADRLNRATHLEALKLADDPAALDWGMHANLAARALERVGDQAVDIGEQVAYLVTGEFREFTDASHKVDPRRTDR